MTLLSTAFSGSLVILAALVLRAALAPRLPRWAMPALWWVALLRLLLPVELESRLSICNLWAEPYGNAGGILPSGGHVEARTGLIPFLWAVGFALCAAVLLAAWLWNRERLRESLPVSIPYAERWVKHRSFRRKLRLRQSDRIESPFTCGILRPVILLPARRDWEQEELEWVLAHEAVHIRHWDGLFKLLSLLCGSIYWFDPLVWVMVWMGSRDLELWCDEEVLLRLGPERRKSYALTLLRLEEERTFSPSLSLYFSTNCIQERIKSIMKAKKPTLLTAVLALALVLLVGTMFATTASADATVIGGADGPTSIFVTSDEESGELQASVHSAEQGQEGDQTAEFSLKEGDGVNDGIYEGSEKLELKEVEIGDGEINIGIYDGGEKFEPKEADVGDGETNIGIYEGEENGFRVTLETEEDQAKLVP